MVKVRDDLPRTQNGEFDVPAWLALIERTAKCPDTTELGRAYAMVAALDQNCDVSFETEQAINDSVQWQGIHCLDAGLQIVQILADLRLDQQALVAGMLYRAVREGRLCSADVEKAFGPIISKLIDGALRMAAVSDFVHPQTKVSYRESETQKRKSGGIYRGDQVQSLRKMLVAMIDDVRVALIKLAERTCALRAVKPASVAKRVQVAREIFDIYAPLAHRLGIGHLKWELEDLSFRYLRPEEYKSIAKQLDERRMDRQHYIHGLVVQLNDLLEAAKIDAEVVGRAKHIYSIWRKMQNKQLSFHQIYDIRAVRVLVPQIRDCYAVLGIIHSTWKHIPREFDDYIAIPKDNGYRSLHTAVLGPAGKVIEVQIRTFAMHDESELGVCAHWLYKEGSITRGQAHYDDKIAWLRQVLDWHESLGEADVDNFLAHMSSENYDDRVYVFTRDGHVVDLDLGATPIDFAYHIHTEVGHQCRGAKVNERIVPLTYKLHTGEQVEIITGRDIQPSRDWLNPHLGYIVTNKARASIQYWFRQQDRETHLRDGRVILERELERVAIRHVNVANIASKLKLKKADDLYVGLARGDLRVGRVLQAVQACVPFKTSIEQMTPEKPRIAGPIELQIDGVSDLLSQTAGCCKPVPGDQVSGYISVGRGIIVHQQQCGELARLAAKDPVRIVDVNWSQHDEESYPVDILIRAYDRKDLLKDVWLLLSEQSVHVLRVNSNSDRVVNFIALAMTLEVASLSQLSRVLTRLGQLPNVISVARR